ncbi:MAG: hypothetical protein RBS07_14295 [Lentimicrobium sp.]|jgi:hypothetical protein|nr:hypothetical protein [Lentimicrobium sp.]
MKSKTKSLILLLIAMQISCLVACKKEGKETFVEPSVNLSLDSITTTKKHIIVWEEILITAHARGENLEYQWRTNHGSMLGRDSATVRYWGCPTCVGLNTVECVVTNSFGSVSDTIMIQVD